MPEELPLQVLLPLATEKPEPRLKCQTIRQREAGRAVFGLGLLSRSFPETQKEQQRTPRPKGLGKAMLADPGQGGGTE